MLAKYPVDGDMIATIRKPAWRGLRVDYQSTVNARRRSPISSRTCRGASSSPKSRTARPPPAGLKRFQVIRQVEKTAVTNPPQFDKAIADLKGPVTLVTDQGLVTVPE